MESQATLIGWRNTAGCENAQLSAPMTTTTKRAIVEFCVAVRHGADEDAAIVGALGGVADPNVPLAVSEVATRAVNRPAASASAKRAQTMQDLSHLGAGTLTEPELTAVNFRHCIGTRRSRVHLSGSASGMRLAGLAR